MNNSFLPDLITLTDENGLEHNFEILDIIELDERRFYALMPVFDRGEDLLNDSGHYTILEAVDTENEDELCEVSDDELRIKLSRLFEDRFDSMFYEN
ncbi:MAG: DUF1292 domain-containing protein [Ruminococcus sp.]|nr:DUF1292 domain-containing protein [Ruminococcus sp.]